MARGTSNIDDQTRPGGRSRSTRAIEDFGTGKANRTTNFNWTLDNQKSTMTAVNPATGDQTTAWIYGTTLAESRVARNDLLSQTIFPDTTDIAWSTLTADQWANLTADQWAEMPVDPVSDVTTLTYNRLAEKQTFTDQNGTVRTFVRDELGRETNDCVTTIGSGVDGTVLQIATAYEVRGMVATITSLDSATPGSGTIKNQVALTYNTFAQLTLDQQSHSGAVTMSTPGVGYAYDDGSGTTNEIRFNELTYPNGRTIGLSYGTSGGLNDLLNRVQTIQDTTSGTTDLASYAYLGLGTPVRITLPEPEVWLDLWGGTSGVFAGLDLFNSVIDQRWQNNITGTPVDIDRYKYGYDFNFNRQWKGNVAATEYGPGGLDEYYLMDTLNRLYDMQRGTLTGTPPSGIGGTPVREMNWTLDSTGNWGTYLTKTSGTTDLTQTRATNTVNEITAIGSISPPATPPTAWVTPAYDAAGNMTTMPQPGTPTSAFTAVFDAWKRMTAINSGGSPVGQYQYDGRHFRIVTVTTETRHFYFTNGWQDIEERVGSSTSMDKQYVWGIRYIDELVCRDDATPERLYACQDANFNLTLITDAGGAVQERFLFDPYGTFAVLNASWSSTTESLGWNCFHQGGYLDLATGLYNFRFRPYSPILGLWLRRDFLRPAGRGSLFAYVDSNPAARADPLGLETQAQLQALHDLQETSALIDLQRTAALRDLQQTAASIDQPSVKPGGFPRGLTPIYLPPGRSRIYVNPKDALKKLHLPPDTFLKVGCQDLFNALTDIAITTCFATHEEADAFACPGHLLRMTGVISGYPFRDLEPQAGGRIRPADVAAGGVFNYAVRQPDGTYIFMNHGVMAGDPQKIIVDWYYPVRPQAGAPEWTTIYCVICHVD